MVREVIKVDFQPLLETVKSIKDIPDAVCDEFENTFRSSISSIDFKYLVNGSIPQQIINNCLTSSFEAAANYAYNDHAVTGNLRMLEISAMLWNPILAKMFQLVATSVTINITEKSEKISTDLPKRTKKSSSPKPTAPVELPPDQVEGIRKRLRAVALTKPHLYQTPFHSHVKCNTPNCEFCKQMFVKLNITKCEGHKRCCTVGWYPHVGPSLWQMLRKRHANNSSSSVKLQPCKSNEIRALESEVGQSSPVTEAAEPTTYDRSGSVTPVPSEVSTSSKRSASPFDWNDDIETYYLNRKRAARSSLSTVDE